MSADGRPCWVLVIRSVEQGREYTRHIPPRLFRRIHIAIFFGSKLFCSTAFPRFSQEYSRARNSQIFQQIRSKEMPGMCQCFRHLSGNAIYCIVQVDVSRLDSGGSAIHNRRTDWKHIWRIVLSNFGGANRDQNLRANKWGQNVVRHTGRAFSSISAPMDLSAHEGGRGFLATAKPCSAAVPAVCAMCHDMILVIAAHCSCYCGGLFESSEHQTSNW